MCVGRVGVVTGKALTSVSGSQAALGRRHVRKGCSPVGS